MRFCFEQFYYEEPQPQVAGAGKICDFAEGLNYDVEGLNYGEYNYTFSWEVNSGTLVDFNDLLNSSIEVDLEDEPEGEVIVETSLGACPGTDTKSVNLITPDGIEGDTLVCV